MGSSSPDGLPCHPHTAQARTLSPAPPQLFAALGGDVNISPSENFLCTSYLFFPASQQAITSWDWENIQGANKPLLTHPTIAWPLLRTLIQ